MSCVAQEEKIAEWRARKEASVRGESTAEEAADDDDIYVAEVHEVNGMCDHFLIELPSRV